ncbi:MAG: hypothetical protein HY721_25635 [Planctomycetes bacterium]|nr:hypothetical protein [Planctomycetota bacterium]
MPPGAAPPPAERVSVSGGLVTTHDGSTGASAVVDFTLVPRIITLTGVVSLNGVAVSVGLDLLDRDSLVLVADARSDSLTGEYSLPLFPGAYELRVDADTLPPGVAQPPAVPLGVSAAGAISTPGSTVTEVDFALTRVVATLLGTVTVLRDGASLPLEAEVTAPTSSPSCPGASRRAPSRRQRAASPCARTRTESNTDGTDPDTGAPNADDDGVVNFATKDAAALLTGYVRHADSSGAYARVGLFAPDSSGEYTIFVNGSSSDPSTGLFQIGCSSGTYRVDVDPGSVPPGVLPPEAVVVSVDAPEGGTPSFTFPSSATTVTEGGTTRLVLELREVAGGVSGTVTLSGSGVNTFVIAEDSNTKQFLNGVPTSFDGTYTMPLPPGTFDIALSHWSLPFGAVPPQAQRVTVSDSLITGVDFDLQVAGATLKGYVLLPDDTVDQDNPGIDCSAIASATNVRPVPCSVELLVPSQDSNVPPWFLTSVFTDPATGRFVLPLSDGTYEVRIFGGSLPPGMLPPAPLTVSVTGADVSIDGEYADCSDDASKKIVFVSGGAATLLGKVQIDGTTAGVGCFIEVIDPTEGHFFGGAPTDPATGEFALTLADRSYDVRVGPPSLPPGLIAPAPVRVSAGDSGITVTETAGVTYADGLLTINLQSASRSISGTVQDSSGNPYSVGVQVFDASGNLLAWTWSSWFDGTYTAFVAPGTYTLRVDPFSLPFGLMAPAEQTANVADSSVSGADFTLGTAAGTLSGRVFYVDDTSAEVGVPAFVELIDAATGAFVAGVPANPQPDGSFAYSVPVGAGNFRLGVSPFSVPPGLIAPEPVSVTVTVNEVSGDASYEEGSHGDDADLTDGEVDFELGGAAATLEGRLVTGGGFPVWGASASRSPTRTA